MVSNPLSYDNLKWVLQYMEANKRLHISRCCPSIRTAERATPLKIDYLEFESGKIKINDTTYSIGIYKKFHVGEAPKAFKVENDRGGVMYEVDKFGIENRNDSYVMTSGDIEVGREFRPEVGTADDVMMHGVYRMSIEDLEQAIQYCEQQFATVWRGTVPGRLMEVQEERKRELQNLRATLIPLLYERDHAPTPFENLIQLNATSEESTYCERYLHNKKHHEAVKQLGATLFGGRKQVTSVKSFRLIGNHIIIRLPVGAQFKIRNTRFEGSVEREFHVLSSIIHKSSYPLDHLHIEFLHGEGVANPIVQKAKMLTFSSQPIDYPFNTLMALANLKIEIKDLSSLNFSVDFLKNGIRVWKERGLPVGTHFTFESPHVDAQQAYMEEMQRQMLGDAVNYQRPGIAWLEKLQREFNGVAGLGSVTIPMSANTQLVVSYWKSYHGDCSRPSDVVEVQVEEITQ